MFHGEPPPEYSISSVIIDRDQRIPEKSRLYIFEIDMSWGFTSTYIFFRSVIKKKEKNNAFRVFWIFLGLFIALVVLTLLGLGIYGIVTILNTTTTRHTASSTQTSEFLLILLVIYATTKICATVYSYFNNDNNNNNNHCHSTVTMFKLHDYQWYYSPRNSDRRFSLWLGFSILVKCGLDTF